MTPFFDYLIETFTNGPTVPLEAKIEKLNISNFIDMIYRQRKLVL